MTTDYQWTQADHTPDLDALANEIGAMMQEREQIERMIKQYQERISKLQSDLFELTLSIKTYEDFARVAAQRHSSTGMY